MSAPNHLVFKPGPFFRTSRAEPRVREARPRQRHEAPRECEQCHRESDELTHRRVSVVTREDGASSVGYEYKWLCPDCIPRRKEEKIEPKTEAELRSILRSARKGLR